MPAGVTVQHIERAEGAERPLQAMHLVLLAVLAVATGLALSLLLGAGTASATEGGDGLDPAAQPNHTPTGLVEVGDSLGEIAAAPLHLAGGVVDVAAKIVAPTAPAPLPAPGAVIEQGAVSERPVATQPSARQAPADQGASTAAPAPSAPEASAPAAPPEPSMAGSEPQEHASPAALAPMPGSTAAATDAAAPRLGEVLLDRALGVASGMTRGIAMPVLAVATGALDSAADGLVSLGTATRDSTHHLIAAWGDRLSDGWQRLVNRVGIPALEQSPPPFANLAPTPSNQVAVPHGTVSPPRPAAVLSQETTVALAVGTSVMAATSTAASLVASADDNRAAGIGFAPAAAAGAAAGPNGGGTTASFAEVVGGDGPTLVTSRGGLVGRTALPASPTYDSDCTPD